ncbi:MAG: NAD(+) synthase [Bacillota bacterium]
MFNGFIKVAAATPHIRVADCPGNAKALQRVMRAAHGDNARLLITPELAVTGYTCSDLFFQDALLKSAEAALLLLAETSLGQDMITIVGLPLRYHGKLYNCAAVLYQGKILGVVPKANIPNYGEFYEVRHFAKAPEENGEIRIGGAAVPFGSKLLFCSDEMPAFKLAIEICEDLWIGNAPSVSHAAAGATIIANLSASNEIVTKDAFRRTLVVSQSAKLVTGYIYADAGDGESTTDLVFSGHNIIAQNGTILAESKPFGPGYAVTELDLEALAHDRRRITTYGAEASEGYLSVPFSMPLTRTQITRAVARHPFIPDNETLRGERCDLILSIQSAGLKKRLEHTGSKTAVIGVSGGLDSTLALLVTARAMDLLNRPRTDVLAVTMPCFGTTKRTRCNAGALCDALGVTLREIDITDAVRQHFSDLGHDESDLDVLYENAQARERTQVLMDVANQTGGLVVGTGDLSELALGFATYNGDHMSMYAVNASVPKTLIRHIIRYYAERLTDDSLARVLLDILDTPVSPELLPAVDGNIAQKTEELVGPYELHDFFLYYVLRWGFAPAKIRRLANHAFAGEYAPEEIDRYLAVFYRRFFAQQFKRSCLPDGPKVGTVTLSPRGDWRMPSDAAARVWLEELSL